ncbi:putative uncharacterized protein [Mycolicibacterium thermoresistibile]|nr:putative uncharacterized protein [Mycolicibacterium thermoresistibile]
MISVAPVAAAIPAARSTARNDVSEPSVPTSTLRYASMSSSPRRSPEDIQRGGIRRTVHDVEICMAEIRTAGVVGPVPDAVEVVDPNSRTRVWVSPDGCPVRVEVSPALLARGADAVAATVVALCRRVHR